MSAVEQEQKTITINGVKYGLPTVDTFDMDESELLYEKCGLTLEDFAIETDPDGEEYDPEAADELSRKVKHPGFMRSLVHVAYQRAHPQMSKARVAAVVGKVNTLEVFADGAA